MTSVDTARHDNLERLDGARERKAIERLLDVATENELVDGWREDAVPMKRHGFEPGRAGRRPEHARAHVCHPPLYTPGHSRRQQDLQVEREVERVRLAEGDDAARPNYPGKPRECCP
jgi:hypothetical protein